VSKRFLHKEIQLLFKKDAITEMAHLLHHVKNNM